ncbi:hypothetical protein [Pseudomonas sp. EA_5y_Pfl2_R50]|uniref:hypothetical protein n=1 Tax=Pseudomonas sp. EA_5y_Pfl2_R50 TaxID=3088691 RepID=UPI0030DD389D
MTARATNVHKYLLPGYIAALFRVVFILYLGISKPVALLDEEFFTDRRSRNEPIQGVCEKLKAERRRDGNLFHIRFALL